MWRHILRITDSSLVTPLFLEPIFIPLGGLKNWDPTLKSVQLDIFNKVLHITNNILHTGQSCSKMYGKQVHRYNKPQYNEVLDLTKIILKLKCKNLPQYNELMFIHHRREQITIIYKNPLILFSKKEVTYQSI